MEEKPLQPLPGGTVLLVGVKASNFDEEIKNHPRIIMWDSQQEHWTSKDIPANTRAIFFTRFIGHSAFGRIMDEARKRRITVFNVEGTGLITKHVKELLNLNKSEEEETETMPETDMSNQPGKLKALIPFIDFAKGNTENARILLIRAKEMKISSTEQSLAQMVSVQRRKQNATAVPRSIRAKVDVSVEILDGMIKELQDMREFIIATTEENRTLKMKLERFRKLFEE